MSNYQKQAISEMVQLGKITGMTPANMKKVGGIIMRESENNETMPIADFVDMCITLAGV